MSPRRLDTVILYVRKRTDRRVDSDAQFKLEVGCSLIRTSQLRYPDAAN
jgi:hypothetical protein